MKSFVNLPERYKNLLNEILQILSKENINNMNYNSISLKKLLSIKTDIDLLLPKFECDGYDINRLVNNYKKENNTIKLLKKFINLKNKNIALNAFKSKKWNKNIDNLIKNYQNIFNDEIKFEIMEKSFINLLQNYKNNWFGYWTLIKIDKKGNIKNISIFDTEDIDKLLIYLCKKNKWNLKDKDELNRLKNIK